MITSTAIGHNRLSPGFTISQLQAPAMRHTPIVATMGRNLPRRLSLSWSSPLFFKNR
jgi:hypothetical protein